MRYFRWSPDFIETMTWNNFMLYMASIPPSDSEDSESEPKRVDAAEFYKPMRGVEIG